jgi:hypothetical protein
MGKWQQKHNTSNNRTPDKTHRAALEKSQHAAALTLNHKLGIHFRSMVRNPINRVAMLTVFDNVNATAGLCLYKKQMPAH